MEKHINSNRDGFLLGSTSHHQSDSRSHATTSSEFVLQWGNRKRLRCMKVQAKDNSVNGSDPVQRTTVRIDRRVVKSDHLNYKETASTSNVVNSNGHLNLRRRPESPARRILRNSESSIAMKGLTNNGVRGLCSPDRGGAQDRRINCNNNHTAGGGGSGSSETAHDSRKGGGSSSGSDAIPMVWPPQFVIGLTNKEKEEDFLAIKGSKLPHRPKKRAKFVQRTLNLVSPGAWLCDLTLERYEVRERKITKKRPRGLKAMGNNMNSDSE